METPKKKNTSWSCKVCLQQWAISDHYWAHMISNHNGCVHCLQFFGSHQGLLLHTQQLHPAEQNITCKCGSVFTKAGALIAHLSANECQDGTFDARRLAGHFVKYGPGNFPEAASSHGGDSVGGVSDDQDPLDADLMSFDDDPLESHGFSKHPNQAHESYLTEAKIEGKNGKGQSSFASNVNTPPQETTGHGTWGSAYDSHASTPKYTSAFKAKDIERESHSWTEARKEGVLLEFTRENIMECLDEKRKAKEERDRNNKRHPSHPSFHAADHYNPYLKHYKCPYPRCGQKKPHLETFIQHLVSLAHGDDKIYCQVCNRTYTSPTAYTQHFESLGKRCNARNVEASYISKVTGGVIKVVGENEDMSNKYGAFVGEENPDDVAFALFTNAKEQQAAANRRVAGEKQQEADTMARAERAKQQEELEASKAKANYWW